jgi:hypothetical protein
MTRTDDFIGRLETYLDEHEGVTPLPDAVRDAIRAELPRTKQAGSLRGLARFKHMSTTMRYGIAAAVIGLAALIGFSFFNNQVGLPTDATPTPKPSASVDLSAGEEAWPAELQHPFLGPAHDLPDGWTAQQAQLTVLGKRFEYETRSGGLFLSRATITGSGQLRLVSTSSRGCEVDQQGLYEYAFSQGGNVMTLSGEDECSARAAALSGDWLRSDCRNPDISCLGSLSAGTYSSAYFEPRPDDSYEPRFGAFTFAVPDGWAAYADHPDLYGLAPQDAYEAVPGTECYDCPGTNTAVTLLSDPLPALPDCTEANVEGVGGSPGDIGGWLASHPGVVATERHSETFGELNAQVMDIQMAEDWTGTCEEADPFSAVPIFYREGSYHMALPAGDRWHLVMFDLGGGHTVVVVIDTDPADLDAFVTEVEPIIDSFDFPQR